MVGARRNVTCNGGISLMPLTVEAPQALVCLWMVPAHMSPKLVPGLGHDNPPQKIPGLSEWWDAQLHGICKAPNKKKKRKEKGVLA